MRSIPKLHLLLAAGGTLVWALATCTGLILLWRHTYTPGPGMGIGRTDWPAATELERSKTAYSVVMFVHPHCPCTWASLAGLRELQAHCGKQLETWVVITGIEETPGEPGKNVQEAQALPQVHLYRDQQGDETRRFGAKTSGQTLLFDPSGNLLFSGGVTTARGHSGPSLGKQVIEQAVLGQRPAETADVRETAVFGCPLLDE